MKRILSFSVPIYTDSSIVVECDILPYMFDHLHRHDEIQITLILKGEGTLLLGNSAYAFEPYSVFFINGSVPHFFKSNSEYFQNPQPNAVHAIHLFFNYQKAMESLSLLPEFEKLKMQFSRLGQGLEIKKEDRSYIASKILTIQREEPLQRFIQFISLLQHICENAPTFQLNSSDMLAIKLNDQEGERMNKVFQYVMSNYKDDIPLQVIADIAHLTPQAFCKYFKRKTRKTFCHFVNEVRISEAIKQMMKGDFRGLGEIAFNTGFKSAVHFNRVFKQMAGTPPRSYLKNLEAKQGKHKKKFSLELV